MLTLGPLAYGAETRVFFISELLEEIIQHLPYAHLLSLACCHSIAREGVKTVMRLRFKSMIRPYGPSQMMSLCDALRMSGGVVVGSSSLWVIRTPCNWTPDDLNIVTPQGQKHSLLAFFVSQGFVVTSIDQHKRSILGERFSKHTTVIFHYDLKKQVTITESFTDSCVPVMTQYRDTSLTTFASADGFFSLYPRLSTGGVRLCNIHSPSMLVREGKAKRCGLTSSWNTRTWSVPCGICCPVLSRRMEGLRNCARFEWGEGAGGGAIRTPRIVINDDFTWRLGDECFNRCCDAYKRG
jgi:hypothetical protein